MADKLDMAYINSHPQPYYLRFWGDKIWWPMESIDVETGMLRIDVCGRLQPSHIDEVVEFKDSDGIIHEPETFWLIKEQG